MWASNAEIRARFHSETSECTCPPYCPQVWDADPDCPAHGEEIRLSMEREQQAEIDAENAWLRAAEAPTNDDYAFEMWEAERGLI